MIRVILLIGALLVWQTPVRAGNAVLLKAYSVQESRGNTYLGRRILRIGEIVKVVAIHGAKADVAMSGGGTVTVRLANLRLLPDAQEPATVTIQQPVVTPTPANPSPSPNQAGGPAKEKLADNDPARPSETARRTVPVRCSHLTKNGDQCSRMTTSPNGLCWQHGGN